MAKEIYDDIAETLRTAIGRNKIKYGILDEMIEFPHVDSIHINVNSILSFITAKYLVKSDVVDENYRYVIASSIINIAAHYRHFCFKRGWQPTIYLYSTYEWSDAVKSALKIIEIICQYLDKIYFLKIAKYDLPGTYMKYFINNSKGNNLILTKDTIDLQLINGKTHVLKLNKDNSIYYTKSNLYGQLIEEPDYVTDVSHKLIGPYLFFSGIGVKNGGVKGCGRKKTLRIFEKAIHNGELSNDRYHSFEDFINDMSDHIDYESKENIEESFTLYDINQRYNKDITISKQKILDSYIIDKFSKKDLLDLNNKYFVGLDSLLLEYLLEIPSDPKSGGPKNLKW